MAGARARRRVTLSTQRQARVDDTIEVGVDRAASSRAGAGQVARLAALQGECAHRVRAGVARTRAPAARAAVVAPCIADAARRIESAAHIRLRRGQRRQGIELHTALQALDAPVRGDCSDDAIEYCGAHVSGPRTKLMHATPATGRAFELGDLCAQVRNGRAHLFQFGPAVTTRRGPLANRVFLRFEDSCLCREIAVRLRLPAAGNSRVRCRCRCAGPLRRAEPSGSQRWRPQCVALSVYATGFVKSRRISSITADCARFTLFVSAAAAT